MRELTDEEVFGPSGADPWADFESVPVDRWRWPSAGTPVAQAFGCFDDAVFAAAIVEPLLAVVGLNRTGSTELSSLRPFDLNYVTWQELAAAAFDHRFISVSRANGIGEGRDPGPARLFAMLSQHCAEIDDRRHILIHRADRIHAPLPMRETMA